MDSLIKFVDFIKDVDYVDFIDSISGSTASYDNTDLKNCPYIKLVQIVKINGKKCVSRALLCSADSSGL